MTQKSETGKLGEDIACEYLLNKSFTVIERNYRKPWGELDIIAKDPKGVLVFVEVKTIHAKSAPPAMRTHPYEKFEQYNIDQYAPNSLLRAIRQYGNAAMLKKMRQKVSWKESTQILPEENLTVAKLKKLKRTAQLYANQKSDLVNDEKGYRIDLLAITINEDGHSIKHFENIEL